MVHDIEPVDGRNLLNPVKVHHIITPIDFLARKLGLDEVGEALDQIGAEDLVPVVEDLVRKEVLRDTVDHELETAVPGIGVMISDA